MLWRSRHTREVQELKEELIETTNLHIFDPDKALKIKTDASRHAVRATLEQEGRPVAFESGKATEREKLLRAYESESRAVAHALIKWRHFIGSKTVVVETDPETLSRTRKQKEVNPHLGYWLDK